MRIKIFKERNSEYLYRSCIFCDGYMIVKLHIDHDNNLIKSVSRCKKCDTEITMITSSNNYIISEDKSTS